VNEEPLGGNVSASVKIGDTVHRRSGPWTPAVHALLAHVRRVGLAATPEPLGIDEQGRAVLRFIEGETNPGWPEPMPGWMYEDDATIMAAARLLHDYHEAVSTFVPPADARWRTVAPVRHEVICHYDWAPYNALFRGHEPIAMLDWDSAGPGTRLWDVAGSAYRWVPLYPLHDGTSHDRVLPLTQQASRLATFCRAYGAFSPAETLDALIEELPFHADLIHELTERGDPGVARLIGWNVPARLRRESELLRAQRDALIGSTRS
jgi:phosphotransferase family enzyme